MQRERPAFNRIGAFIGIPMMLLVLSWMLYRDRLPQVPDWVWAIAFVTVAVSIVTLVILARGRRMKALRQASHELGLEFSEVGDETSMQAIFDPVDAAEDRRQLNEAMNEMGVPSDQVRNTVTAQFSRAMARRGLAQSELRRLSLFHDIENPRGRNVMSGRLAGGEALIFDYSYGTPTLEGRDSIAVVQTVAAFRFRGRELPAFELSRRDVIDRVMMAAGVQQEFDFAANPELSRRFRLRSEDANAVRGLFNPAVLEVFERLGDDFRQTVEGAGDCIVVYSPGRTFDAAGIKAFVKEATTVASAFKR